MWLGSSAKAMRVLLLGSLCESLMVRRDRMHRLDAAVSRKTARGAPFRQRATRRALRTTYSMLRAATPTRAGAESENHPDTSVMARSALLLV